MFMFHVAQLGDAYLIAVNTVDAWFYLAAVTALLAVGVPWLATRPQPKPRLKTDQHGRKVWA